jgi:tRNA A37 threonylcarbamoyltransferase TsaD
MASKPQSLVLNGPEFTTRAANFAHLMATPTFQKQFFADPSAVAAREFGLKVPSSTATKANAMVFALLGDKQFNNWAKDFQKEIDTSFQGISGAASVSDAQKALKSKQTRDQLVAKFNASVAQRLSPQTAATLAGLNKGPLVSEGDVAVILLTFVVVIVVVAIAAGIANPAELVSRQQVQLVARQITASQIAQVKTSGR